MLRQPPIANGVNRLGRHALRAFRRALIVAVAAGTVSAAGEGAELGRTSPADTTLRALRIHVLPGESLELYTDVPPDATIECLPEIFAQAIPQWRDYFGRAPTRGSWKMRGYLMQDPERFRKAGLLPPDLPPFLHGYQQGDEFWLYDQPSDYYRRHLVLHEGTHGYAQGVGAEPLPPWFREGLAERLATHLWGDGDLHLAWFPTSRDLVPHWGRIKLVQDEIEQQRPKSLREVLEFPNAAFRQTQAYAWSWAAVLFLEKHPATAGEFETMRKSLADTPSSLRGLTRRVQELGGELEDDWYLFAFDLQYGQTNVPVPVVNPSQEPRDLPDAGVQLEVAADQGWRNTGIRLRAGQRYRIDAEGRYTLAQDPRPWWCEPGGVTIDYVRGKPLGQLLSAVAPEEPGGRGPHLVDPSSAGPSGFIEPAKDGLLFLCVNDRPGDLSNNQGTVQVTVAHDGKSPP